LKEVGKLVVVVVVQFIAEEYEEKRQHDYSEKMKGWCA
jgi:hypothetical protein